MLSASKFAGYVALACDSGLSYAAWIYRNRVVGETVAARCSFLPGQAGTPGLAELARYGHFISPERSWERIEF
jgi:hypothetical protein